MTEENTTKVTYKAVADFISLTKAVQKARRELAALRREEAKGNAASVAQSKAAEAATNKQAKSVEKLIDEFEDEAIAVDKATGEIKEYDSASQALTNTVKKLATEKAKLNVTTEKWKKVNGETVVTHRNNILLLNKQTSAMGRGIAQADKFQKALRRVGNWRPRLTPPFIALIPIIGAVLALINPLVAGLGAVAAAGFGFATSLGSIAGAAVGLVPLLATLLSMVAALKVAFGGIGGAFKAFGAMKEAAGGGGGGGGAQKAELTRTEQLQRAQEDYARSLENVKFAQEDLDDARKDYIKRLRELRKEVERAALAELRAAANAQLAREDYFNILADPGSTKGQKMDAAAGVEEAVNALEDVRDANQENADALAKMQQEGIEGDRQVIMAKRALIDAIEAERDAILNLQNVQSGANAAGGGGASVADEYRKALEKLSPSARRFVEIIVGMDAAWTALKKNVQEAFFSQFVDDVERLNDILPSVESLLSDTAGATGRVVRNFLRLVTSPQWGRDLVLIGEQNVPIIENIGNGLIAIVDGLKDVTIAAGPFVTRLSEGFKEGSENFANLVANARETGSLASWLDKIADRMAQWWRIIKNIGATLFNFGAASESFGKWLTDGFEAITEGWRAASEEARKEGSPFQQYLENVRPLLSEVRGLFADFFSWLGRTMGDQTNIDFFTEVVRTVREDLGPAIADIIQKLADTGVGESFVQALSSIVEVIDTIIANGGADAIKGFFDVVGNFFKSLRDVVSIPGVGAVVTTIVGALAGLAAVSFIGKFTGLTALIGWLIKGAKTPGVLGLLSGLGRAGSGAAGAGVGAVGSEAIGGAAAKGGILAGAAKGGFIALIVAGLVQAIGSAASVVGSGISNISDAANGKQSWQQAGQNLSHDANAAVGPPGVGVLTGLIDSIFGTTINEGWADFTDGLQQFFEDTFKNVGNWFNDNLITPVAQWFFNNVIAPFSTFVTGLMTWWDTNIGQPLANLFATFGEIWETRILPIIQAAFAVVGEVWNTAIAWIQTNVFAPIAGFFQAVATWVQINVFSPIKAFFYAVATWVQVNVFSPIKGFFSTVATWIQTNVFSPIKGFFSTVATWIQNSVFTPVKAAFDGVISFIRNAFTSIVNFNPITAFNNWMRGMFGLGKQAASGKAGIGGYVAQYLASGGGVRKVGDKRYNMDPKGTDTVPTMLTPGEYVVKRERVSQVGARAMQAFNDGTMSLANLVTGNSKNRSMYMAGGGVVPGMGAGLSSSAVPAMAGTIMNFGDINVYNAVPERASETLPRTIRKISYVGSRGAKK